MQIEIKEIGSKQFYREVANIAYQCNYFKKNHSYKKKDLDKCYGVSAIISFVFAVVFLISKHNYIFMVLALFLASFLLFVGYILIISYCQKLTKNGCECILTIDEKGVKLQCVNKYEMQIAWDNVALIRSFDYCICFISSDATNIIISISKQYEESVRKAVQQFSNIKIID